MPLFPAILMTIHKKKSVIPGLEQAHFLSDDGGNDDSFYRADHRPEDEDDSRHFSLIYFPTNDSLIYLNRLNDPVFSPINLPKDTFH